MTITIKGKKHRIDIASFKRWWKGIHIYQLSPDEILKVLNLSDATCVDINYIMDESECEKSLFHNSCLDYARNNYQKFVKKKYKVPDNLKDGDMWSRYILAYLLGTYHCAPLIYDNRNFSDEDIHSAIEDFASQLLLTSAAIEEAKKISGITVNQVSKKYNVPPHVIRRRLSNLHRNAHQ